jgi:hypothetical protein
MNQRIGLVYIEAQQSMSLFPASFIRNWTDTPMFRSVRADSEV